MWLNIFNTENPQNEVSELVLGLKEIIVWLSSTTFLNRCRQADFFFSNQSQSYMEL